MLLFDQNLSHKLVNRLQDAFPNCIHVRNVHLDKSSDLAIWRYAYANSLHVVTLDRDFIGLSKRLGHPPCIIWLRTGNCNTADVEHLLRQYRLTLKAALDKEKDPVVVLPPS